MEPENHWVVVAEEIGLPKVHVRVPCSSSRMKNAASGRSLSITFAPALPWEKNGARIRRIQWFLPPSEVKRV